VSIGRYPTRSEAVSALTRLQIAGYNDAYVTSVVPGLSASTGGQSVRSAQSSVVAKSAPTTAPVVPAAAEATQTSASSDASQAGRFRLRTHDTQSGQTTDLQVSQAGGSPAVVAGVGADKVPPHLRNKLVYLDGVPHIKDGDSFIPIDAASDKP